MADTRRSAMHSDDAPNPPKKTPNRHHVKRRSFSRVHVAKLAPLTRAMHDDACPLPRPLGRSQSSRTHRPPKDPLEQASPPAVLEVAPTLPPPSGSESTPVARTTSTPHTSTSTAQRGSPCPSPSSSSSASLSRPSVQSPVPTRLTQFKSRAAPAEQNLHVTASAFVSSASAHGLPLTSRKPPLRSQFVPDQERLSIHTNPDDNQSRASQPTLMTDALDQLGREYLSVRRFHNPVADSLWRCRHNAGSTFRDTSSPSSPSVSMPLTGSFPDSPIPHFERRELIRLQRANPTSTFPSHATLPRLTTTESKPRWSASALVDRLWYGNSHQSHS